MNVLLIGGNGFIGSHLVDKLLEAGHKVRVFDKYEESYRKPLPEVDYRFGDFSNRGLLADALAGIDNVVHLISTTLPKTSNDDPVFDVQSNVVESIFLLEQCVARKIKRVIFISSGGTVYGKPETLPIGENSPTDPKCSYGITKLTIEKYLALFNLLYGLDYVVLRPSNAYGERQNPNNIQGAVTVFLSKVARGEPIEIWGDGDVVRDYIYIDDLVEGIYRAVIVNSPSRIFNLGSGTGYSLNEIVAAISRLTGRDVKAEYKPKRSFDVSRIILDISRARQELRWKPSTSLDSGIMKTWAFIKELNQI
ncbi:NAD-dependent epimerase/dehydratase family protein [Geobacter anodireducens]|uniref:UDP-glucose 4-epimerase n=3 Tax=Geobacter TaxID=28231 RepID=A0A0C1R0W8_9BACT|nr:NAD-dependent epimerase/dehydratase family protein [Geobacter soli]KIE44171.1 NAD-dependent epimerase [Geobacter soli]MBE2887211.1 NAD-dependent epimerase/dehydratase family protein [Geobacter anodireducens]